MHMYMYLSGEPGPHLSIATPSGSGAAPPRPSERSHTRSGGLARLALYR